MGGGVPEELFEFHETLRVVEFLDKQVRVGDGIGTVGLKYSMLCM